MYGQEHMAQSAIIKEMPEHLREAQKFAEHLFGSMPAHQQSEFIKHLIKSLDELYKRNIEDKQISLQKATEEHKIALSLN